MGRACEKGSWTLASATGIAGPELPTRPAPAMADTASSAPARLPKKLAPQLTASWRTLARPSITASGRNAVLPVNSCDACAPKCHRLMS